MGVAATGAALPGCERETHRLVPYLLPDDEIVPGVANWYATVCGECDAGCGLLVRVMEGRAKKIEGNPDHPLSRGKHCARAEAGLQALYNPDRIKGPLRRTGARGEGAFEPIAWNEAVELWVEQLRRHPGKAAFVSRPLHGTLAWLFAEFAASVGGSLALYEPGDRPVLRSAFERSLGTTRLPRFDLKGCDYLLSFGAPFLQDWLSPVHDGIQYGEMRRARPAVRGRFVQVEPRLSATGACADRWVPARPGTEALLALGIGRSLLERGRGPADRIERRRAESLFHSVSLADVAAATDVSEDAIAVLARELAESTAPVVIAGGAAAAHTNGTTAVRVILALNRLLGERTDGLVSVPGPSVFPAPSLPPAGGHALVRLAEEFASGKRTVLHLSHTNPLYTMPPSTGFARLFERAAFTVSFSSFLDESSAMADLILPDHVALESWGDHPLPGVVFDTVVGLRQPAVRPLYDTRFVGDVLLDAAKRLGAPVEARLPWPDFRTLLRERWRSFHRGVESAGTSFDAEWSRLLQQGGWWRSPPDVARPSPHELPAAYDPPTFQGDPESFPFHFHPYPSPALHYGEGANKPWLQELPDPLTTVVWNSWVEVNPRTAGQLGIRNGELVRVTSPHGTLVAPAVHFPGLRPDVIAMPIGWGHRGYGRYAADRGSNPYTILGPAFDEDSGSLATGGTRVRIEPTGRPGQPIVLGSQIGHHGEAKARPPV